MKDNVVKTVKKGTVQATPAAYHDTISVYRGNPLIEALRVEPELKDLRRELGLGFVKKSV